MKVKATRHGYYGMNRRKPGELFDLVQVEGHKVDPATKKLVPAVFSPEDQFAESWMEKVDAAVSPESPEELKLRKASAAKDKAKNAFGAKKEKAVGYAASLESPTGDLKVI